MAHPCQLHSDRTTGTSSPAGMGAVDDDLLEPAGPPGWLLLAQTAEQTVAAAAGGAAGGGLLLLNGTLGPTPQNLALINRIAYFYITPIVIGFGVVGDLMSISVLSHPLLRKNSVVYSYLLALAVADLLTLASVVPPLLWIMKIKLCGLWAARYYAHVGFPLANAFMGASVYVVVFLTFNQYIAVCHPFFHARSFRSRRACLSLTALAYAISFSLYIPWAWRKTVRFVGHHPAFAHCPYEACDDVGVADASWYRGYQWTREVLSRFVPFLLIAYFNIRILLVYRRTRNQRMDVLGLRQQKLTVKEKTEREERRLWLLLFAIMSLFFVCTIPAAPFTIMVSDRLEDNLPFQIVRTVTNVLEFTKFALNFYLYCMINPDIRKLCVKRLTCQGYSKPPMVGSRNSYNLTSLLQMTDRRRRRHSQQPNSSGYHQQHSVPDYSDIARLPSRQNSECRQGSAAKRLLAVGVGVGVGVGDSFVSPAKRSDDTEEEECQSLL